VGWEKRERGGLYYTRRRRVGGRVVREYIGTGPAAEAAAALDEHERQTREELRKRIREAADLDESLREAARLSDLTVAIELVKAGYHNHKGEWRRTRERKQGEGQVN
jgi:hypothetical protein